jgi:hypothetical protein
MKANERKQGIKDKKKYKILKKKSEIRRTDATYLQEKIESY